ncbi:MAG TPA: flotillin domain-containing protein, partial [Candidatus Limnocylindrales bacterium]|nr:flotillin domain-containing protein [Candidatus Limnocylindrales bacterium]
RRAEGDKQSRIAAAQAEAERVKLAGQAEAAVQVTKGEAQARVTEVNAEAIAKQTTLEGNAEAGITFTKGEAEAKALALRADAYRQFNEAAIISTVLSMLPEIIRAAAEPMSNIDSLTVLSSDGASEVVRNATRTVTEASTTVKGLTGIDIPVLINNALGGTAASEPAPPPKPRRGGAGGSGGSSGDSGGPSSGGTGGGSPKPSGPAPAGGTPAASASAGSAAPAETAYVHAQPASESPGPASATPTPEPSPAERFAKAAETMRTAAAKAPPPAAPDLAGLTSQLPPLPPVSDMRPSDRRRVAAAAAGAVGLNEGSTLSESAVRLAEELRRVPGIERFGGTRLRDLERSGPRTLRTLWGAARDELQARYGDVTIGTLLDEYERGAGGGTSAQR